MPLKFPNQTQAPPGGWRFHVVETGRTIKGVNRGQLIQELEKHYTANSLAIPNDIPGMIEAFICQEQPGYCIGDAGPGTPSRWASFKKTIAQVTSGTRTLSSWVVKGRPLVSQEEADRRAEICSTCQFNVSPSGCTGCSMGTLREVINSLVGNKITKDDAKLQSCSICGCALKAKVWVPLDIIQRFLPKAMKEELPGHCWVGGGEKSLREQTFSESPWTSLIERSKESSQLQDEFTKQSFETPAPPETKMNEVSSEPDKVYPDPDWEGELP